MLAAACPMPAADESGACARGGDTKRRASRPPWHCGPSPQRWSKGVVSRGRGQHHCLWLLGRRVCGAGAPRQPGSPSVPSVVPPALAAPAVETVDAAALSFLLAQTLAAQQQEEVEAKEQAAVAELEEKVAAAEDWLLRELE